MGREARQRKERRNRQLTELALTDPKRFEEKWSEKLNTWASEIWCAQRDQAYFTFKEYDSFISKYPKAKTILKDLLRDTKGGYFLYLDKITDYLKDELGADAVSALLSKVRQGGLRGGKTFAIADHAQRVLASCGERAVALQKNETAEILQNECCRALAANVGREMYTLNKYRKHDEKEANYGKLKSSSRR